MDEKAQKDQLHREYLATRQQALRNAKANNRRASQRLNSDLTTINFLRSTMSTAAQALKKSDNQTSFMEGLLKRFIHKPKHHLIVEHTTKNKTEDFTKENHGYAEKIKHILEAKKRKKDLALRQQVVQTSTSLQRWYKTLWIDAENLSNTTLALNETVDCAVGQWQKWSPCSTSCGGGTKWRARNVSLQHGLDPAKMAFHCPTTKESRSCMLQNCTCANKTTASKWSSCSATCGGGTRTRVR